MYCIIWNLIKIEIAFFTVKVIKLIQGQKLGIKNVLESFVDIRKKSEK